MEPVEAGVPALIAERDAIVAHQAGGIRVSHRRQALLAARTTVLGKGRIDTVRSAEDEVVEAFVFTNPQIADGPAVRWNRTWVAEIAATVGIVAGNADAIADLEQLGVLAVRADTARLGAELALQGAIGQRRPTVTVVLGGIDTGIREGDRGKRAGAATGETKHAVGTRLVASAAMLGARHAIDTDLLAQVATTDGTALGGARLLDFDFDTGLPIRHADEAVPGIGADLAGQQAVGTVDPVEREEAQAVAGVGRIGRHHLHARAGTGTESDWRDDEPAKGIAGIDGSPIDQYRHRAVSTQIPLATGIGAIGSGRAAGIGTDDIVGRFEDRIARQHIVTIDPAALMGAALDDETLLAVDAGGAATTADPGHDALAFFLAALLIELVLDLDQ
jgi:hypothetical protein